MNSTSRFALALYLLAVINGAVWVQANGADRGPPVGLTPSHQGFELTFSGEHRARYEALDAQFRPWLDQRDRALAFRTSLVLSADAPRWRLLGELVDSRATLNDENSVLDTSLVNTLEPLQLVATRTWRNITGANTQMALSLGRMTLDVGTRRLIARNVYRNTAPSFLGIDWRWQGTNGRAARVFYVVPMIALPAGREALLENDQQLDRARRNSSLRGIYYQFPALRQDHRLELYAVEFAEHELLDRRDLTTYGARSYRPAAVGRWHYELEVMRQSGRSTALVGAALQDGLDHDASFHHAEFGYTFDVRGNPTLTIQFDEASGDSDPTDARNGRFDTLYSARRFELGPTGIFGPFARSNLETPGLRLGFAPGPRWQALIGYRRFRLSAARDAWTTTGLRDPAGRAGRSLGRQVEASFTWHTDAKRLSFEFGMARFAKGGFVEQTAPERSMPSNYLYAAPTVFF